MPSLILRKEQKIYRLISGLNKNDRLEASDVLERRGQCYVVFDNRTQIASLRKDLKKHDDNQMLGSKGHDSGFECITFNKRENRFYVVIEALGVGAQYKAQLNEYDASFQLLEAHLLDFVFCSGNKGFEGAEYLVRGNDTFLLALCEGNKCAGGKKGRKPGGGRIQIFKKSKGIWNHVDVLKLPRAVEFVDYAGISLMGDKMAIVSQSSSALWVGQLKNKKWGCVDDGQTYAFPKSSKGKVVFGNVEGVCWLAKNQVVAVSDKSKSDQPKEFKKKDQSIHIFEIPRT